ncbi:M66 family metalloprotease [Candidatus Palauibacter sp.]|uniref:M66 family metalloprotease n=1 Tax=Candidatus Palauibacter sp. TaxID=3101350 RepID=UPI003B0118D0
MNAETFAHELGHNLSLFHVLCRGDEGGPDPSYPYEGGGSGVWGYDPRDGGSLVPPDQPDFMTCCDPTWVSDYYFANALRNRPRMGRSVPSCVTCPPVRSPKVRPTHAPRSRGST